MMVFWLVLVLSACAPNIGQTVSPLVLDTSGETFTIKSGVTTGKAVSIQTGGDGGVEIASFRRDDANQVFPVAIYGRTWPSGFEELDLVAGEHSGNAIALDSGAVRMNLGGQAVLTCSAFTCGFPEVSIIPDQRFGVFGQMQGRRIAQNNDVGTSHMVVDTLANTQTAATSNSPMFEFVTRTSSGFQKMGIYMRTINGRSSLVFAKAVNTVNYSGAGEPADWVDIAQIDAEGGYGAP